MIKQIAKLWSALRFFVRVRKRWDWPKQSDVLIYDATGHEFLLPYLELWSPVILHLRGEEINMRVLLASLVAVAPLNRNRYFDTYIRKVQPRLIVTFIDNNYSFYTLAERHPGVKTLFVQNGVKSYYLDVIEQLDGTASLANSLKVHYMMTFGSRPGALYAKYIQGSIIPIGSIRNNMIPKSRVKNPRTIAFVSQYRGGAPSVLGGKPCSFLRYFVEPETLVLKLLAAYAKQHGKELLIITMPNSLGAELLARERDFFSRVVNGACYFSEWSWHGSSYQATDAAEVVVTIDSALGYESAARGNKTAFFSIRGAMLDVEGLNYGWPKDPEEGPFWTNRPDPVAFERILDHLFSLDDEQWRDELTAQGFADIMEYDPGNSILQSVLRNELGAPPARAQSDAKYDGLAESASGPGSIH